jgi:hypothetical protein
MRWTIFLVKFSEYSRDQEIVFTDAIRRGDNLADTAGNA